MIATEDLVDARDVAEMLGVGHPNAVSVYQQRYDDMPRPVVDLGRGRPKLWLRPEIERWAVQMSSRRRGRKERGHDDGPIGSDSSSDGPPSDRSSDWSYP